MQLFVLSAVLLLSLMLPWSAYSHGKDQSGSIVGSVNYCSKGGVLGMRVFVPGKQLVIYTGSDGRFQFVNLDEGEYTLYFALGENIVNASKKIQVNKNTQSDLGTLSFCAQATAQTQPTQPQIQSDGEPGCLPDSTLPQCIDSDKDGVVAAKDCDDNNDKIRPGAPEQCDGLDNNCNGVVDDLGEVWVDNGVGHCSSGAIVVQSCKKGFADCDGKANNGCETNIREDNDNCGFCGNVCPGTEICVAGMC
ncbi:MopE-related protein [Kaarinaea lacus]